MTAAAVEPEERDDQRESQRERRGVKDCCRHKPRHRRAASRCLYAVVPSPPRLVARSSSSSVAGKG
ncbi:hypothetical protein PIB30_114252 [Stylosanthes scabra]|uniref:Uncharacterized protein n=1 Tax=Stylosanthes scabra TaxID=79078 RepID=A0ABU6S1A3_9FABA|nr:hypothetical protein [Stylosanthes scabra]